jgi:hypothetical protein
VTLTLESSKLDAIRQLLGARSLSAAVDAALETYVSRLRHLAAVDEWLLEMEREHGPTPVATPEWAARIVGKWEKGARSRRAA